MYKHSSLNDAYLVGVTTSPQLIRPALYLLSLLCIGKLVRVRVTNASIQSIHALVKPPLAVSLDNGASANTVNGVYICGSPLLVFSEMSQEEH